MGATIRDIVSQQKLVEQRIMSMGYVNKRVDGTKTSVEDLLQMVENLSDE